MPLAATQVPEVTEPRVVVAAVAAALTVRLVGHQLVATEVQGLLLL
jgi:hypothetical protein